MADICEVDTHISKRYDVKKRLGKGVRILENFRLFIYFFSDYFRLISLFTFFAFSVCLIFARILFTFRDSITIM